MASHRMCTEDFSLPAAHGFDFPEGEHGILLLHGFTACPAQLYPLGVGLRDAGFAVRAICLPGHGKTPRDMAASTWRDWLDAARSAARDMRSRYPLFTVAGLSMGGVLSLILAEEMDVDACVTLAAPMKAANPFACIAPYLYFCYPTVHSRENPAREQLDARYDLGYVNYPTRKVGDLNTLIRMARKNLNKVRCPLLSIQSHRDTAIVPESLDVIQQGASSAVKAQLWLSDAPHVITLSPELPEILEKMTAFLRAVPN